MVLKRGLTNRVIRTSIADVVLILALTAFSLPASATSLPMVGSLWSVLDLVGTKLATTHAKTFPSGVEFPFPNAGGSPAGYVLLMSDTFTVSLTASNTLTATFEVVATSGTIVYMGNPNGGCPASSPSLCPGDVRLYFQANTPSNTHNPCGVGN